MKKGLFFLLGVMLILSGVSCCFAGGMLDKILNPEKAKIIELKEDKEIHGEFGILKSEIFALRFINLLGLKKAQIAQMADILEKAQMDRIAKLKAVKEQLIVGEADADTINAAIKESNDAVVAIYDQLDGLLTEKQKAKMKRLTAVISDKVTEQLMALGMTLMEEMTKKGRLQGELGEEPLLSEEMMGSLMEFAAPVLSLYNSISTKQAYNKKLYIAEVLMKPECVQILKEKAAKMVEKAKGKVEEKEEESEEEVK